jgi:uncharacterized BrkB/YihY/UPF0761 family membrane protein
MDKRRSFLEKVELLSLPTLGVFIITCISIIESFITTKIVTYFGGLEDIGIGDVFMSLFILFIIFNTAAIVMYKFVENVEKDQ